MTARTQHLRRASVDQLDGRAAMRLARLRIAVFVVEQACPYPEVDGRDVEAGTEHLWFDDPADPDGAPLACLRVLSEPDGARRVGRVCTRLDARGAGLAALLMADVLDRHGDAPLVLDAQAHLAGWYARFGFAPDGAEFVEDGIPHVPMRRPAGGPAGGPQGSEATSSASGTRGPV